MVISLIVAMTKRGVIGKDNSLPWNIPEELSLFKEKTLEKVVVMGRKTWDSLPKKVKPLKNRINVVLSNQNLDLPQEVYKVDSIKDALKISEKLSKDVVFIGGSKVYSQVIDMVDKLYVSLIKKNYDGDSYFPDFDFSDLKKEVETDFDEFTFFEYAR